MTDKPNFKAGDRVRAMRDDDYGRYERGDTFVLKATDDAVYFRDNVGGIHFHALTIPGEFELVEAREVGAVAGDALAGEALKLAYAAGYEKGRNAALATRQPAPASEAVAWLYTSPEGEEVRVSLYRNNARFPYWTETPLGPIHPPTQSPDATPEKLAFTAVTDAVVEGIMSMDRDELMKLITPEDLGNVKSSIVDAIAKAIDQRRAAPVDPSARVESDWFAGEVDADGNELVTVRKDEWRRIVDEREKFIWQVRDTCGRAEKVEAQTAELKAEVERKTAALKGLLDHFSAMQHQCVRYLEPSGYTSFDRKRIAFEADRAGQDALFINDMIYLLDGPEQREVQNAARAALGQPS